MGSSQSGSVSKSLTELPMEINKSLTCANAHKNAVSNVDMYKKYISDQKEQITRNNASYQDQIANANAHTTVCNQQLTQTKQDCQTRDTQQQAKIDSLEPLLNTVKDLNDKQNSLNKQIDDITGENTVLKAKNEACHSQRGDITATASTLLENQAICQAHNAKLTEQLTSFINQINGLKRTVNQNINDMNTLNAQITQNNISIADLTKSLSNERQLNESSVQQINALTSDNQDKMQQLTIKQGIIDECNKQINELTSTITQLQGEVAMYQVGAHHLIFLLIFLIIVSVLIVVYKDKLKNWGLNMKDKIRQFIDKRSASRSSK